MPYYKYDRGDGRFKHCWNKDEAGFEPGGKGPVGKCPNSISQGEAEELLNSGLPWFEDEDDEHPSYIFNVRKGIVYEAQPTVEGISYHGYPWCQPKGRKWQLPLRILEELRRRAALDGHAKEFNRWMKDFAKPQ